MPTKTSSVAPTTRYTIVCESVPLTGRFERKAGTVDVGGVLREIDDAKAEEVARKLRMQTTG